VLLGSGGVIDESLGSREDVLETAEPDDFSNPRRRRIGAAVPRAAASSRRAHERRPRVGELESAQSA